MPSEADNGLPTFDATATPITALPMAGEDGKGEEPC